MVGFSSILKYTILSINRYSKIERECEDIIKSKQVMINN